MHYIWFIIAFSKLPLHAFPFVVLFFKTLKTHFNKAQQLQWEASVFCVNNLLSLQPILTNQIEQQV